MPPRRGRRARLLCRGWRLYSATTLNKFADDEGINPRAYYAIDTFSGFTFEDANYEVTKRGETSAMYAAFCENKNSDAATVEKFIAGIQPPNRPKSVERGVESAMGKLHLGAMDIEELLLLHEQLTRFLSEKITAEKLEKRLAQLNPKERASEANRTVAAGKRPRRKYPKVRPNTSIH